MSCPHCGTADERGRFCDRCGKRLPVAHAIRRVTLPRRPSAGSESATGMRAGDVQGTGSAPQGAAQRAARGHVEVGGDDRTRPTAEIRHMYDTAMARAAVHGHRPLQRYVSVLIAPS